MMQNNMNIFNNAKVIGQYNNGNYSVIILSDGTKIRYDINDNSGTFRPEYPESIDLCITKKCDVGCPFCYENCHPLGEHANYADMSKWKMWDDIRPYTEIAMNGNDMDFPDMLKFLEMLKEKKCIPNITVNLQQFIKNVDTIRTFQNHGLFYGIGISLGEVDKLTSYDIQQLRIALTNDIKNVVFHIVLGLTTYESLTNFINTFNTTLNTYKSNPIKILFLGYKKVGRGILYHDVIGKAVDDNIHDIEAHLDELYKACDTVSFDNLAVTQLQLENKFDAAEWQMKYMGDDGRFSMYIDAVSKTFAKNSCVPQYRRCHLSSAATLEHMFKTVQNIAEKDDK